MFSKIIVTERSFKLAVMHMVSHFKTVFEELVSETFIVLFSLPETYFFIPVGAYTSGVFFCVSHNNAGHHNWQTCKRLSLHHSQSGKFKQLICLQIM